MPFQTHTHGIQCTMTVIILLLVESHQEPMAKALNTNQPNCKVFAPCPSGFKQKDLGCFKESHQQMTWDKALEFCKNTPTAGLLNIKENFQNYIFTDTLESMWIGLSVDADEDVYTWNNDAQDVLQADDFNSWAAGFPKPNDTNTCGVASQRSWSMVECNEEWSFICYVPALEIPRQYKPTIQINNFYKGKNNQILETATVNVKCVFKNHIPGPESTEEIYLVNESMEHVFEDIKSVHQEKLKDNTSDLCLFNTEVTVNVTMIAENNGSSIGCRTITKGREWFKSYPTKIGPMIVIRIATAPEINIIRPSSIMNTLESNALLSNTSLNLTCRAQMGTEGHLQIKWIATIRNASRNVDNLAKITHNAKDPDTTELTSTFFIDRINKSHDLLQIGCVIVDSTNSDYKSTMCIKKETRLCDLTDVFRVISHTPEPPRILTMPKTAIEGKMLRAVCEANDTDILLWLMIFSNKTVSPDEDINVVVEKTKRKLSGDLFAMKSVLTIKKISEDHKNMRLLCFSSRLPTNYSNLRTCSSYTLCDQSGSLQVNGLSGNKPKDGKKDEGKDSTTKAPKYERTGATPLETIGMLSFAILSFLIVTALVKLYIKFGKTRSPKRDDSSEDIDAGESLRFSELKRAIDNYPWTDAKMRTRFYTLLSQRPSTIKEGTSVDSRTNDNNTLIHSTSNRTGSTAETEV